MNCALSGCNATLPDPMASYSMTAVLQRVDPNGYAFFQCQQGQLFNYAKYQHFTCTPAHMQQEMQYCINTHYNESNLQDIPGGAGSTILHDIVLQSNLQCKVCQAALLSSAYRFCLTIWTPVNSVPDSSTDQLQEWCCSLEHARQSALAIIQAL